MPTDWAAIDQEIKDAATATDTLLASRIAAVTRLTNDEVKRMFPTEADAKRLAELMDLITAATTQTEKVNRLVANIERLGTTVVLLLRRLAA